MAGTNNEKQNDNNNDNSIKSSIGSTLKLVNKADIMLLVFFVVITLAAWIYLAVSETAGTKVTIQKDGELYGTYSLFEDTTITIEDNDEINVVVIKDGVVYMEPASCHNQVCVEHSSISTSGESIICLPNRVIVKIDGDGGDNYDAIAN